MLKPPTMCVSMTLKYPSYEHLVCVLTRIIVHVFYRWMCVGPLVDCPCACVRAFLTRMMNGLLWMFCVTCANGVVRLPHTQPNVFIVEVTLFGNEMIHSKTVVTPL